MTIRQIAAATLVITLAASGGCKQKGQAPKKDPAMTTPKQILFYEDDTLIETEDAATVPESVRYVEVDGKKIEVAKVVARTSGETRAIEQYSSDGVLLLRTLQRRDPSSGDAGH